MEMVNKNRNVMHLGNVWRDGQVSVRVFFMSGEVVGRLSLKENNKRVK